MTFEDEPMGDDMGIWNDYFLQLKESTRRISQALDRIAGDIGDIGTECGASCEPTPHRTVELWKEIASEEKKIISMSYDEYTELARRLIQNRT